MMVKIHVEIFWVVILCSVAVGYLSYLLTAIQAHTLYIQTAIFKHTVNFIDTKFLYEYSLRVSCKLVEGE